MIRITFPDGTEAEVKTATDATRLLKQVDEGLIEEAENERRNWRDFDKEIKRRLSSYERTYPSAPYALTTHVRNLCKTRAYAEGFMPCVNGGRCTDDELDYYMQIIDDILPLRATNNEQA